MLYQTEYVIIQAMCLFLDLIVSSIMILSKVVKCIICMSMFTTLDVSGNVVIESWKSHVPPDYIPRSPMVEFLARSRLHCVILSGWRDVETYPWRCQAVQFQTGMCRMFAQSVSLN